MLKTGGFIRLFLDMGPPMADLLKQLHRQGIAVDYIEKLLAAFREDAHSALPDASVSNAPSPHHPLSPSPRPAISQPLVEPLTNRELDVLELLAQRWSNKEIAEKLFISTVTVKGHLLNIYGKLNVRKRRDAVEKAHTLDILKRR